MRSANPTRPGIFILIGFGERLVRVALKRQYAPKTKIQFLFEDFCSRKYMRTRARERAQFNSIEPARAHRHTFNQMHPWLECHSENYYKIDFLLTLRPDLLKCFFLSLFSSFAHRRCSIPCDYWHSNGRQIAVDLVSIALDGTGRHSTEQQQPIDHSRKHAENNPSRQNEFNGLRFKSAAREETHFGQTDSVECLWWKTIYSSQYDRVTDSSTHKSWFEHEPHNKSPAIVAKMLFNARNSFEMHKFNWNDNWISVLGFVLINYE